MDKIKLNYTYNGIDYVGYAQPIAGDKTKSGLPATFRVVLDNVFQFYITYNENIYQWETDTATDKELRNAIGEILFDYYQ